jgi:hypothetical protein
MEVNKIYVGDCDALTKQEKKMYNDFVNTLNNNKDLLVKSLKVDRGISTYENKQTLAFDLETTLGLTDEKAYNVFDEFLKKYPYAHIEFNKPNLSVLAQMFMDKSETTLVAHQPITFEIIK